MWSYLVQSTKKQLKSLCTLASLLSLTYINHLVLRDLNQLFQLHRIYAANNIASEKLTRWALANDMLLLFYVKAWKICR